MRSFVTLRRLSVLFVITILLTVPAGFAFADDSSAAEAQEETSSMSFFEEVIEWVIERIEPEGDSEKGPRIDPMG